MVKNGNFLVPVTRTGTFSVDLVFVFLKLHFVCLQIKKKKMTNNTKNGTNKKKIDDSIQCKRLASKIISAYEAHQRVSDFDYVTRNSNRVQRINK